jgi:hypothetical protein
LVWVCATTLQFTAVQWNRDPAIGSPAKRKRLEAHRFQGYDFEALGSATIAPGGLEAYTAKTGIPGWADSLLVLSLLKGVVYRVKLNGDGRSVDGEPKPYFKSTNRYRDIAAGPDNKTFYFATDSSGNSTDASGQRVRTLDNPGAIVAFTYTGSMGSSK